MQLTNDIYGQRKLELVRGIELAEGEYHSAALKEQTGAGTPESTKAAKDHLAKLRDDLEALEGAWIAAKAQSQQAQQDQAKSAYDSLLQECDDHLTTRRTAVLAAQEAAKKLADAIVSYEAATRSIRSAVVPFQRNAGEAAARSNALSGLEISLDAATWAAAMAGGAAIGDAGVHVFTSMRSVDVFGSMTAAEYEDKNAARIRSAIGRFAPQGD